jgi:hypothetical protein
MENEERAADPLAGGIMQEGYQCGMLWGAALAVGAESSRRSDDRGQAIGRAMTATEYVLESFMGRTNTADCLEITDADFSSKLSFAKYMFSGRFISCFKLADKWAPEAIDSATEGLSRELAYHSEPPISCASEVVQKMGASDEEMAMVAGFAGGLGLSGNACGALAATMWLKTLAWCREHPGKSAFRRAIVTDTIKNFYAATDYKILCNEISEQSFKTIDDHTEYINNGGCAQLIDVLAQS